MKRLKITYPMPTDGSTSHLQYLKETPKDYHFWYVCSDGLSTLKQRKITILASIVIIV